jgi:hypothetical protein
MVRSRPRDSRLFFPVHSEVCFKGFAVGFEFQFQGFTPSLSVNAFGVNKLEDVGPSLMVRPSLMEGGAGRVPHHLGRVEELLLDLAGTADEVLRGQNQDDGLRTELPGQRL